MANYKPIDLSKEDFRKYLDRQGVLDAITKVLVKCNTDRPENALGYVLENLNETHGSLKTQLYEAHQEIDRLKMEISTLKMTDETGKTSSTGPAPSGVKEEAKEIDNVPLSNGAATVVKKEEEEKVGEVVGAITVKQEKEAVTPSTSGERNTSEEKAKDASGAVTAASTTPGKEEAQEPVVATASASPANEAPEAKEPNTGESSK